MRILDSFVSATLSKGLIGSRFGEPIVFFIFMEKLILTPAGFKTWEVVEDFDVKSLGKKFIVPKGFRTDLASVPRIFWNIVPPFGRYTQAAVVHDYLYKIQHPKLEADKIFYDLMIKFGTYKWKAKIMYWAVFLFGGSHY